MFVDTFIRRPILASVCSLVLILAGAVAIPTMPVAQYPNLASPQGTIARQRPIDVGEVLGNDYIVTRGLSAGERIVVSGIQKIGDGAPVKPE